MSRRSSQSSRPSEATEGAAPPERPVGCFTRLLLPAIAVYFVIRAITAFARPDYLPTHDGPHHILSAWLLRHAEDAGSGYLQFVEAGHPFTALGFLSLFRIFEPSLGWQAATSAVLGCIVALWSIGGFLLARKVEPHRAWLGLFAAATAGQWVLYMGFFSFAVGLGLALFALLAALSRERLSWPVVFATGAMLTLVALCHVAVAAMTGVAVLAIFVARERPSRRTRGLVGAMIAGLPAAIIAALTASGVVAVDAANQGFVASPPWPDAIGDRFFLLARTFTPGTTDRELVPLFAALAGITITALDLRSRRARPLDVALAVTSLGLFALALSSPINLFGWQFFAPRPMPLAVMLGVLTLPLERFGRFTKLIFVVWLIWFTAGSLQWTEEHNRKLDTAAKPALAGLQADLHRSGPRLPLIADPIGLAGPIDAEAEVPFAQPLLNVGLLYAVAQGGMAPYFFANVPQGHPFVFKGSLESIFPPVPARDFWRILRDPSTPPDAPQKQAVRSAMAAFGAAYEDVILFGSPADVEGVERRGYVADVKQGGLFIGRFTGCPLRLSVTGMAAGSKVGAELGWFPALAPTWSEQKVATAAAAEGSGEPALAEVDFAPTAAPCGAVWIRAYADANGSGRWDTGERVCRGAGPEGFVVVDRRDAGNLRCELAAP
jgi:hypothetical protein